ncbi:hypothetical protein EDC04DRAFT_2819341 [Pisolithus marmoratus]|nr:hypothetical protein EDC04DRAFT_2819341 [Pisolithus marmoratus]
MDELNRARAELARLQCTERTLIEQLLAVRVAMETQKNKINKLVEERPSPINRLPTELLARILSFVLMRSSKTSRLWSDLILNTPYFWSEIVLTRESSAKSLMTQLKRSHKHLLEIAILYPLKNAVHALWDILIPSRGRWRSFIFETTACDVFSDIMNEFNHLTYPCLQDLSINSRSYYYPVPLSLAYFPALRHLNLGGVLGPEYFSMATIPLTTLSLSNVPIPDQPMRSRLIRPLIARTQPSTTLTQSLTALTINYNNRFDNRDWVLERDTLHLPALQRLLLNVVNPCRFMNAIVAPKLKHFHYIHCPGSLFGMDNHTLRSKFDHVCHFTLKPRSRLDTLDNSSARVLCQAFSGVRCASIPAFDIDHLFVATHSSGGLGPQSPADNWESLERLSLICGDASWSVDALAKWLAKRQELGLPLLHVELIGFYSAHATQMTMEEFSFRYKRLRDYCVLDFKDMQFPRVLRLSTDGGLLNVRADKKDGTILKNWRESPLENMGVF